jgi:hypothetical protein
LSVYFIGEIERNGTEPSSINKTKQEIQGVPFRQPFDWHYFATLLSALVSRHSLFVCVCVWRATVVVAEQTKRRNDTNSNRMCSFLSHRSSLWLTLVLLSTFIPNANAIVEVVDMGRIYESRPDNYVGLQMRNGLKYPARLQFLPENRHLCGNTKWNVTVPSDGLPGKIGGLYRVTPRIMILTACRNSVQSL